MTKDTFTSHVIRPACPFCGVDYGTCKHFKGYTENGRIVEGSGEAIRSTWKILKTGVSARVYAPLIDLPEESR